MTAVMLMWRSAAWSPVRWRRYAWAWLLMASCALAEGLGLNAQVMRLVEDMYGLTARARVEALGRLIDSHRNDTDVDKLLAANRFFNDIPYDSDQALWGREDYWATPIEMLSIKGADCEDYAIAKYFTLLDMGVPAERLRITYVKAIELNQAHMVLAYYPRPDAEPLILDNLIDTIKPATERVDLVPVYGFNGESLWLSVSRSRGQKVGRSDRINLWNDVRKRMAKETKGNG